MRYDIALINADKGGAAVILDVKHYVKVCERQLNNTKNYKHSQNNPTATNNELVHNVIKRFEKEKLIQKDIAEGLKINYPQAPRFYTQPKIHKERKSR